jgi:predicted esterase
MTTNKFTQIVKNYIYIYIILFTLLSTNAYAQVECAFRTLKPKITVSYATDVPLINYKTGAFVPTIPILRPKTTVNPKMDIYEPNLLPGEPSTTKFPLVIVCHGHGSSRLNNAGAISIATEMAKRGFITCVIDYRNDLNTVLDANLGLFWIDYYANMIKDDNIACDENLNKQYLERVFYSNAMDVQNAITFMVNNQSSYRVNVNKVIVGGHSLGAATTNYCLYVDKDEMTQNFPSTFMTDSRYIDLNLHRNRLGAGFSFAGTLTDINYIDADEKTPIFMAHGTHDAASPFYIGRMLCEKEENMPLYYGSGAMAEKLDAFPDNLGFSYYLVQLNGISHSPFVTAGNLASSFTKDFWQDDFFRYLYNVLFPPSGVYPKNQVHKIVTPINPISNYCDTTITGVDYYYANLDSTQPNHISKCGKAFYSCLSFVNLNLTTKPWVDNLPNFCTNLLPLINFNTKTNDTCYLELNQTRNFLHPITKEILYTGSLNGNYNFLRKINEKEDIKIFSESELKIFPNPTSNYINIESSTDENIQSITIISTLGQVVYQTNNNDKGKQKTTIDISNFANGNYLIRVGTDRDTYTKKIIKQN